jgi:hypothetical protein
MRYIAPTIVRSAKPIARRLNNYPQKLLVADEREHHTDWVRGCGDNLKRVG